MSEWWTYRPSDFLMFSPRTYWRMLELYNRDFWPAQALALAAGLVATGLAAARGPAAGRAIALLLVPAWLWAGWAFHWARYADINWAARYLAGAFLMQAVLLAGTAALAQQAAPAPVRAGGRQRVGLALAIAGVLFYPLAGLALGRPLAQAEVFGMAPEPTALATLGLLLVTGYPPALTARVGLLLIPALSLLVGVATLWVMAG